jgi:thrombospondin motif-containing protein 13
VHGGWSEWSHSECSKTCGTGGMTKTRECNNPSPDSNGNDCIGDTIQTIECQTEACPGMSFKHS